MNREKERERQRKYRQGLRAQDETRGDRTNIDPENYKRDVPVQVWLNSNELATLSEWLDEHQRTKFMSEIVSESIRILVGNLVTSGEATFVEDTLAAREMLEWKYRIKLKEVKDGTRGKNNIRHNATLTEKRRELGDRIGYVENITNDADKPIYKGRDGRSIDGRWVSDEEFKKMSGGRTPEEINKLANEISIKNRIAKGEVSVDSNAGMERAKEADDKAVNMPIGPEVKKEDRNG